MLKYYLTGDAMSVNANTLKEEEKYLTKVKKVAKTLIDEIDVKITKEKQEIFELKKYIWNDCKSLSELEYGNLLNDTDAKVEITNEKIKKVFKYEKILDKAYFGRIDFKLPDETINVYIGLYGLNNENENYIFDWRAPISSLFYDYTMGKASYEAPMGMVVGEITLRRQYKIEKGKLKRIVENDINIDDEVLQEVLSSHSTDKMKNIVTTIQKEQNQIIRNTKDKYLIVQGIAGSGKTSVALHRIAYLLYKEKGLTSNNILIFSPNNVFSEYISDVLPELGEENVLNTTFNDIVKTYLKKYKKIETFSEFLKRKYDELSNGNMIKNIYTKEELDEYLENYLKKHIFKSGITLNGFYFNHFELNELLMVKYKKLPFTERIEKIAEYICHSINVPLKKYKTKIKNILSEKINIDLDPIYIFKGFLDGKNIIREGNKLYYDDISGIIYLYFQLNDFPYNSEVKHMVVDEAQDYSPLQFWILKKIFPKAFFTILGDINQAINPDSTYKSLEELKTIFDIEGNYIELNKTYRSSSEIIEFASNILNINNITSIRGKNGFPVLKRESDDINDIISDLKKMKSDGMQTIAIITKDDKEMNNLYKRLLFNCSENVFVKNTIEKNKISILPSYIAKGLEFDGVIVYTKPDNYYTEEEKKLYYVVCTRAQHQLIVYNQPSLCLERPKILKKDFN